MTDALLEVEDVTKHFPITEGIVFKHQVASVKALDGVSLTVRRGETLGIVGESGCGKSTLARVIMRLLEPTSGSVRFEGRDITRLSEKEMRAYRRELMMIFQDPYASLNPRKRVGFIVGEPLEIHGLGTEAERKRRVQELLDVVGLNPEHYNRFPHEFSGGQRQRIGVARALAVNPKLIVADEPVSALDVSVQAQILNLLKDLQSEFGLTYVFIAHDLSVVRHISDRVAVMYLGKLVELARSRDLYAAPRHPYTGALLSAVPIANPRLGRGRSAFVLSGDVPNPINPPSGCRFHPRCPRAHESCSLSDPPLATRAEGHEASCFFPLEKWPMSADEMRRREPEREPPAAVTLEPSRAELPGDAVIARGLRDLALVLLAICGLTALGSLLLGVMAGIPASRAVSGGYLLVGSLLFIAGALVGLRDPSRSREREVRTRGRAVAGRPATWAEAFHLSAILVGVGFALVLLGVALHPRVTF